MSTIISIKICKSVPFKTISKTVVRLSSTNYAVIEEFRERLKSAGNIVFLTGAGISEESGLPTFTGSGTVWRNFTSLALMYPPSFIETPSLYWEFYNYRRELAAKARPNMILTYFHSRDITLFLLQGIVEELLQILLKYYSSSNNNFSEAHIAIANFELKYGSEKQITTITQNVDSMHSRAGSVNLIELKGSLFKTLCTACKAVVVNTDRPICPALANTGSPEVNAVGADIAPDNLPRCGNCGALLRPYIVWFGESVDSQIKEQASEAISKCDVCLVVSTPTLAPPASTFPAAAAARKAVVAEFNVEPKPPRPLYKYYFEGLASRTLPVVLAD